MDSTTKNLNISLTVMQVLSGLYVLLGAFILFDGPIEGKVYSDFYKIPAPSTAIFFLSLLGLIILTGGVAGILILNWAKEWQARAIAWTRGANIDKVRFQALTSTLGRWMVVFQWVPVVILTIVIVFILAIVFISQKEFDQFGFSAIALMVVLPIVYAPEIVINWLILKSIRIWLLETSNRITTQANTLNLVQQSNIISSWFLMCQIVLGLGILSSLFSLSLEGSSLPATILFVAVITFYVMVLEWSKRFAQGVSAFADRHT
jgi:hypothetical protein